ncbi:MAG TPA: hypothetical protein VHX13_01325 [Acidobacteriaceae bacterium]|nr:hypothetical protein [Acidobacteriaceae bacterium]
MRPVTELLELAATPAPVDVTPEEYNRLLGYPRGHALEGRACELADWARAWYAEHGRPWFYARQAESFAFSENTICIDGAPFASPRLGQTIQQAEAHDVVLVAVGAGPELEEEARCCWESDKPDDYFFLEMYGSAVVEHLITLAGAQLCDWAEQRGMAVLPHASPGYADWDVAEQPRLLEILRCTRHLPLPSNLEALESGMLRPRKSLLAVFGLTRRTELLRRLTELVPCENCTFGPCAYRRAPWRRSAEQGGGPRTPVRAVALDPNAAYTMNRKALERWSKDRLSLRFCPDGSLEAAFRYDGTTCTNMGRPLAFDYTVQLGPRAEGYPIRAQLCSPAAGDTGHTFMCEYREDPERLMNAIAAEQPLHGAPLNAILAWQRETDAAGCFCGAAGRHHKWGLVLETIHYALAHKEPKQEPESR